MTKTKNALIRYRVIDQCLRRLDEQWTWRELARKCADATEAFNGEKDSFSERTIKKDLSNMRHNEDLGYFAPIGYDRKEKSYYYEDRTYSITESPLNKQDRRELTDTLNLLKQYTGFSYLSGINNVIGKLQLMVSESNLREDPIVQLEQPVDIPGQKWLDSLYRAIRERNSLSIYYHPFLGEASHVVISPLLLKEFDHRWYLLAYSHDKGSVRTYGLERISELRESFAEYTIAHNFSAEIYFKNVIGITVNENSTLEEITFKVQGVQIQYLDTKFLHSSQKKIEIHEQYSVYSIKVHPNYELESKILSLGTSIEILSPLWLRKKIADTICGMNSIYK